MWGIGSSHLKRLSLTGSALHYKVLGVGERYVVRHVGAVGEHGLVGLVVEEGEHADGERDGSVRRRLELRSALELDPRHRQDVSHRLVVVLGGNSVGQVLA